MWLTIPDKRRFIWCSAQGMCWCLKAILTLVGKLLTQISINLHLQGKGPSKMLGSHSLNPSLINGSCFIIVFWCELIRPGARFSKVPKPFGPEKPFVRLRPAYSVKLVFSYVVKRIKTKITAKFRASRRLRFEDTKRYMSPAMRPKSFGTFEKRAPDVLSHLFF